MTAANPCAKMGAKANVKMAATMGAKAGDKSVVKPSVKKAVKPSAEAAAETTAKLGDDISSQQRAVEGSDKTPVGVSAGGALPTAETPSSGGPSATRGRSASGLAADALRRSKRSWKRM